jgi:hypothetical protein
MVNLGGSWRKAHEPRGVTSLDMNFCHKCRNVQIWIVVELDVVRNRGSLDCLTFGMAHATHYTATQPTVVRGLTHLFMKAISSHQRILIGGAYLKYRRSTKDTSFAVPGAWAAGCGQMCLRGGSAPDREAEAPSFPGAGLCHSQSRLHADPLIVSGTKPQTLPELQEGESLSCRSWLAVWPTSVPGRHTVRVIALYHS